MLEPQHLTHNRHFVFLGADGQTPLCDTLFIHVTVQMLLLMLLLLLLLQ